MEDNGLDRTVKVTAIVVIITMFVIVIANVNWVNHVNNITNSYKETVRKNKQACIEKENAEKIRQFITEDSLHQIAREILNSGR